MARAESLPFLRSLFLTLQDRTRLKEAYAAGLRTWLLPLGELSLLAFWVMIVGREYLVFDPGFVPTGREFLSAVSTHHLWERFSACGWCALWNGAQRGGFPAFVDPHGSMLHPIVMLTTSLFGVINGTKVTLLASLWFAGVAQWWIARELRLGWLPRIWSALLVVVGGHLAGRMELGALGVVLSTAMCSLAFPAALSLLRSGGRREGVILGVVLASAVVAGQGYMQAALLASLPAFGFLVLDERLRPKPIWREVARSAVLALLLAAPFLVPFLHFYPNFVKDVDPQFSVAQPLSFLPLNLVIDDTDFFLGDALSKQPFPHLYVLYIGWTPVLLAFAALLLVRPPDRRMSYFFVSAIFLIFLAASAVSLRMAVGFIPALAGIRHPPQIAGLAVPLILGLAAYGLHQLLRKDWPTLKLEHPAWRRLSPLSFSLHWVLLIPLVFSIRSAYTFAQGWLAVQAIPGEVAPVLEGLATRDLQWVQPPFGRHDYIEPAIARGFKLSPGIMTWGWKDRDLPRPILEASAEGPPAEAAAQLTEIREIAIYALDSPLYAEVRGNELPAACAASGTGGRIRVTCDNGLPGRLVVQENMWTGWKAWRDGFEVPLLGQRWLEVKAPAGEHVYEFRYLPWDVPLGLILLAVGMLLAAWWLVRSDEGGSQLDSGGA